MPSLNGAGFSDDTHIKQDHFEKFLRMHMQICKGQMRGRAAQPPYVFFDLNAGPGVTAGGDGSPLIFAKRAVGYEFPCLSYHFDCDTDNCRDLSSRLSIVSESSEALPHEFNVMPGDHNETIECALKNFQTCERRFCGLVYADPNGSKIPVAVINKILSLPCFARLEVLINTNANAIKRTHGRFGDSHPSLSQQIDPIKKSCVILREPVGKWQWSLILLTNWAQFPVMERQGFHRLNTTLGQQIFNVLDNKNGPDRPKVFKTPQQSQLGLDIF